MYISTVNVSLPDILDIFFPYVQVWNSNNPYLSKLSYLMIPESKFTRGDVSKTIGAKAFFVSASDKIPWLLPVIILFLLIKLTDYCEVRSHNRWLSWIGELVQQSIQNLNLFKNEPKTKYNCFAVLAIASSSHFLFMPEKHNNDLKQIKSSSPSLWSTS